MELYLYLFFKLYPVFLVPLLIYAIVFKYREHIQYKFWLGQEKVLLKISIPREIEKTPQAMENFFDSIYDTGREGTIKARWLLGKKRPEFSFEIASIGGSVYFFVWCEALHKDLIKRNFYANYPGVEIEEVSDYTKNINYDPEKTSLFAFEYKLAKADPYPIKTYKQFGLDKGSIDDQTKTDPLSTVIESLAGVGPDQQIWLQIVIRGHAKDKKKKKDFLDFLKTRKRFDYFDWTTEAKDLIKDMEVQKAQEKKFAKDEYKEMATKREKEVINAIVENVSKTPYEVGIRSIYIAPKNNFKAQNIPIIAKIFRPFASADMNAIVPSFVPDFDYDWMDRKGKRIIKIKKSIFSDYRRRVFTKRGFTGDKYFFIKSRRYPKFILSSEELATIFHIPTKIIHNSKIDKAGAKKVDAPTNLPF